MNRCMNNFVEGNSSYMNITYQAGYDVEKKNKKKRDFGSERYLLADQYFCFQLDLVWNEDPGTDKQQNVKVLVDQYFNCHFPENYKKGKKVNEC